MANICHEGKPGAGEGTYKVHVRHRGTGQWYQIQDLIVEEIIPQMIFLSESYIQVCSIKFGDLTCYYRKLMFFFPNFYRFGSVNDQLIVRTRCNNNNNNNNNNKNIKLIAVVIQ